MKKIIFTLFFLMHSMYSIADLTAEQQLSKIAVTTAEVITNESSKKGIEYYIKHAFSFANTNGMYEYNLSRYYYFDKQYKKSLEHIMVAYDLNKKSSIIYVQMGKLIIKYSDDLQDNLEQKKLMLANAEKYFKDDKIEDSMQIMDYAYQLGMYKKSMTYVTNIEKIIDTLNLNRIKNGKNKLSYLEFKYNHWKIVLLQRLGFDKESELLKVNLIILIIVWMTKYMIMLKIIKKSRESKI